MGIGGIKSAALHLNSLRKFLGNPILFQAIGSRLKLEVLEQPPSGEVLVLAPHPDDDILGCGGTLAYHTKEADAVKVVYICDGSGSGEGDKRALIQIRQEEARQALKVLGVEDCVFWPCPDGALSENRRFIEELSKIIKEFKPKIIYAPYFLDAHPDHFNTACLLAAALQRSAFSGQIFSYETWSPLFANRLIKIDWTAELKQHALSQHRSQTKTRDYLSAIMGLNQYRANMFGIGRYAEAFFACRSDLYIRLVGLSKSN